MSWQPMKTAPRDGTNILLAWGQDGVSQGHYIPGLPHPWKFIDTNNGITWLINHAVDNEYGPTHWQPMPSAPGVAPREDQPVAWLYRDHYGKLKLAQTEPPPDGAFPVFAAAGVREALPPSDEQLIAAWEKSEGYRPGQIAQRQAIDFARSVLRAFGVALPLKGQPE